MDVTQNLLWKRKISYNLEQTQQSGDLKSEKLDF